MGQSRIKCAIVEVDRAAGPNGAIEPVTRELPPWADPFIAQLTAKYRLRAALEDSLRFLQTGATHQAPAEDDTHRLPSRFSALLSEGQHPPGGDRWPW